MIGTVAAVAATLAAAPASAYDPIEEVPADFKMPEPLTLEQSLASFRPRPDLRIELVAAEPMVADPINLDWGADGKLWVVEMADYPLGLDGTGKPGGRVRFLEDTDGDGKYDRSTLFLDGLNFPTGLRHWREGVLVVAAPEIFYAEDTDGDGRADKREVLFRGFREGNQQHRVNGLVWGLDGWLHLANGDSGGTVESVKTGRKLELGSFDLKIRPDTGEMELTSGRTQYGRARDDYGNWFGCNNSRPLFHFVLNDGLLRRNPHVIYPRSSRELTRTSPEIFPIGEASHRYNNAYSLGHITSACGLTIHRDYRLGGAYYGNAFICEPVHNLVHRRILKSEGLSFTGSRAPDEPDSEFLASSDTWFRPTAAVTGPGGGLWIVDMHRYVIEHPEWIPKPWQKVLDLRAGHNRGRIYRVVSEDCESSMVPENLKTLSPARLPGWLKNPNGTERDRVHQELIERNHPYSHTHLRNLFAKGTSTAIQVQTLYTLEQLRPVSSARRAQLLEILASTKNVRLKQHALRLVLGRVSYRNSLGPFLEALSSEEDIRIRFELALGLGDIAGPEAGGVLARLAIEHADDPHFLAGAMSSLPAHLTTVARAAAEAEADRRNALLPYLFETAVATGKAPAIAALLEGTSTEPADRFQIFAAFLDVLDRRRTTLADFRETHPTLESALGKIIPLARDARERAEDSQAALPARMAAVTFLGQIAGEREADGEVLASLTSPRFPDELQRAAIGRLAKMGEIQRLLSRWNEITPAARQAVLTECLADRGRAEKLLSALESKKIAAGSIDSASRDRLLRYSNSKIRERAKAILGAGSNRSRQAAIDEYAGALKLEGNRDRGRLVFQAACAICHRLDGVGRDLGANLTALTDKTGPSLLTAILDPNRAVEDKYLLYEISLNGGETLAGMIGDESGDSLTLQLLDGSKRPVLRNQIAAIRSTGRSAMPEGLEAALTPRQIADLIAFIQGARGPDR